MNFDPNAAFSSGGLAVGGYIPAEAVAGQIGVTPGVDLSVLGGGGGTDTGTVSAQTVAAQQAAAAAAQKAAQANAVKSGITGLVNNIKGVYDALYGDVGSAAAEKSNLVDQKYQQEQKSLTDQFNSSFPAIGNAYGARGTYDSSYRINAEKTAQDQFDNSVGQLGTGRNQDLAGVGQWVAQQQADFNAQKGGLDAILGQIGGSDNVDELTSLRNTLDERLRTLSASRAGLQSQGSYLNTLNSVVPQSNRLSGLQSNLGNVIQSQVPTAVKRAIGQQLINNSGLSQQQAAQALQEFTGQLASEDEKQVTA
jgi:hypothetical protein